MESHNVDSGIVRLWLERLRSGSESERAGAASELSRLGMRTRGSVRTRGGLRQAASSPFANEDLQSVLGALQDESPMVRREVAFALGECGDEQAANILKRLVVGAGPDTSEEVRRAAVAALGTIGGPTSVETLCQVADGDLSEAIRYDALAALTELTLQTEPGPAAPASRTIPTRGAVRTRGAAIRPRNNLGDESRRVLETLQRIRDNVHEKEHLRRLAEAALAPLME